MSAAALSFALFALRGVWMLSAAQQLQQRWVKIVPHVIDTVLLASAIVLAWQIGAWDNRSWLVAKIAGLLVYIALGTNALKRGETRNTRAAAFVAAVATFLYIVSVAITKSPWGIFARL